MDGFTDAPQSPSSQTAAVPATPTAPATGNPWAVKVTLSEPIEITDNGGQVLKRIEELFFRKPTAMDIIEVGGNPVIMDMFADDPMSTLRFDGKQMSAMMARLSATPPPFLAKMSTPDWTFCAWQLSGFFLPAPPKT
ncbi:phage tail assembly protein [Methylobacterium fujisawaense]|uniref:phage tail assembly protein n=1 Tax=Methylobacterium fujisawaense TaxID=107400 RepID=UPI003CE9DC24